MSRRGLIRLTPEEITAFLDEQRTVILGTRGQDGWPHLMPLWYVVRDGALWAWTYARSQKVRNLERDPRCTLLVESGELYHELRGAMFKARAAIHRDAETVASAGAAITRRYGGGDAPGLEEFARRQAPKRVALEFAVVGTASWDHGKLGGAY